MKKFIDNLGDALETVAAVGIGVVLFCAWVVACYWVGYGIAYIIQQMYLNY